MQIVSTDIANFSAEALVNASNGVGWMGGFLGRFIRLKGVAESLHFSTKGKIEREAKAVSRKLRPRPGDVFLTGAHGLKAKFIFHAVTMEKPGQRSSLSVVEACLHNVLETAREHSVRSIAIPLLGTGTGRVLVQEVLELYRSVLGDVKDIEFFVVTKSGLHDE